MKPLDTLLGVVMSRVWSTRTDVAVVRGDETSREQAAADLDDIGTNLLFGVCAHLDRKVCRQRSEQK